MTIRLGRSAAGAVTVVMLLTGGALAQQAPKAEATLDFAYFRANVEPVLLKKREGHARCYTCHAESNNAFRLEKLAPDAKVWSEEQSRRNFTSASALVVAGKPAESRLLLQPLAPERGGNIFHSGGRQFASRNDPDWKALARWVSGAKLAAQGGSQGG